MTVEFSVLGEVEAVSTVARSISVTRAVGTCWRRCWST